MKNYSTEFNTVTVNHAKWARGITLACALLVALGGLSVQAAGETNKEVAGVYTLMTVNKKKVPATLDHDGTALQIRSGSFTINADGTCRSKITVVPPAGAETTVEVKATYTLTGEKLNTLKMKWENAGATTGTVEGKTFTMNNEGMVFSYQK